MKKYVLIVLLTSFAFASHAQDTKFSIVAGLADASVQNVFLNQGFDTGSGYYVGAGYEFSLSNRASIYSELTYSNINSTDYIQLPVLYKYRFAGKISILLGPQLGYVAEESARDVSSFSIGLGAALRYDFTNWFYAMTRYTFQLNNHYYGPLDIDYRIDVANIGIGFKF